MSLEKVSQRPIQKSKYIFCKHSFGKEKMQQLSQYKWLRQSTSGNWDINRVLHICIPCSQYVQLEFLLLYNNIGAQQNSS